MHQRWILLKYHISLPNTFLHGGLIRLNHKDKRHLQPEYLIQNLDSEKSDSIMKHPKEGQNQKEPFEKSIFVHQQTEHKIETMGGDIEEIKQTGLGANVYPQKDHSVNYFSQLQHEIPNSEITRFSTPLRRNQITIKIHDEYALRLDNKIRKAFEELNTYRESQGLRPYYASIRFRPVSPPIINDTGLEIQVAPMNFAHLVMFTDLKVSTDIKEYVQNKIVQMAEKLQDNQLLNTYNCNHNPLGIEILILTEDNRTLLRRRGASVLEAPRQWDCSFSGYCGRIDKRQDCTESNGIDIGLTVEHEMRREIGTISADNREIIFTGFHRNSKTGALDMLGIWKTESTTEELVQLLTKKYPGTTIVFGTTERADEPFVWDAENLIIDFDYNAIVKALKKANASLYNLIPEVFWCIVLGLQATGKN